MLFADLVARHFDSVTKEHGLLRLSADQGHVRYENETVSVSVKYDGARSFELRVEIGQKIPGGADRLLSLGEILRLKNVVAATAIDDRTARNTGQLSEGLRLLAEFVQNYAVDFLSGDGAAFDRVAEQRALESSAYALGANLRSARAKAQSAWEQKNYSAVVAALAPVRFHLSPAETKRLEFSAKRQPQP